MADKFPKNTDELLALIQEEWLALMKVVDRLSPEQMLTTDAGGWTPKDNLAHLTIWMHYMKDSYLNKMPAHEAMGIDEEKFRTLDENAINGVLLERTRDRSTTDVLDGLKSTYADIIETLRGIPFADLMKPLRPSGPDKRLVMEGVLGNTSDHFYEHRLTIEKVLQNRTSEAK